MLVNLIAIAALELAEVFKKASVSLDNAEVAILDSQVARHRVEVLLVGVLHVTIPLYFAWESSHSPPLFQARLKRVPRWFGSE
jgi:hypothetical protein